MGSLGTFRLQHQLGRGGMASVWGAVHEGTGTPAALKLLDARFAQDEQLAAALRDELLAVAAMDHEHIVWILDSGSVSAEEAATQPGLLVEGTPWFAMEKASGGDLSQNLPGSWEQAQEVLGEVLQALAHAHARGVLHRDLKPANVLRCTAADTRPGWKLSDFGISVRATGAGPGSSRATLHYAAPEVLLGHRRDWGPEADLYALGCTAWALICGAPPYAGLTGADIANGHIAGANRAAFEPRFPLPLLARQWVHQLLQRPIRDRFGSASAAADALRSIDSGTGWAAPGPLTQPSDADTAVLNAFDLATPGMAPERTVTALTSARHTIPQSWGSTKLAGPAPLHGAGQALFAARVMPFVGRERERDALWEAFRGVDTMSRVVLIEGSAGLGTTRLAAWMAERAHELAGARMLRLTAEHDLVGMLHSALRTELLGPSDCRNRLLTVHRSLLGPDPVEEADAVTGLVAKGGGLPPQSAGERFALVARLLKRMADQAPLVVVLDPVSRCPDGLAFVAWEAERASAGGTLFLLSDASERIEEAAGVREVLQGMVGDRVERLCLHPLEREHTEALLDKVLDLDPMMRTVLARRVAGSPAYVVEMLADWTRRGLLEPGPRGFVLPRGRTPDLPGNRLVISRSRIANLLAGLPPLDGRCLDLAALIGDEVDSELWLDAAARLGWSPSKGLLTRLLSRRLATGSQRKWRFGSAATRMALLTKLADDPLRSQLTDAVAAALGTPLDPETALRRAHLFLAEDRLEDAWDDVRSAMASPLLYGLRRRSLLAELLRVSQRVPIHHERHADIVLWESWDAYLADELDRVEELLQPLLLATHYSDWVSHQVRYRMGKLLQRSLDYGGAAACFAALEGHPADEGVLQRYRLEAWATCAYCRGDFSTALALLDRADGLRQGVWSLGLRGMTLWASGDRGAGRAWMDRALAATDEKNLGDRGVAHINLGLFDMELGDHEAARVHLLEARRLYRSIEAADELFVVMALSFLALFTGDVDSAEAGHRSVLDDRRCRANSRVGFHARLGLIGCSAARARWTEVDGELAWLAQAMGSGRYTQTEVIWELEGIAVMAEQAGGPQRALPFVEHALGLARHLKSPWHQARLEEALRQHRG
jgi:tetratricopeptide (TPR) repeat protein